MADSIDTKYFDNAICNAICNEKSNKTVITEGFA